MKDRSFRLVISFSLALVLGGVMLAGVTSLFQEPQKEFDISREACPNKIENFKNSVNWYLGKNRITVMAKTACSSKYGDAYELSDVNIEVRSGNRLLARGHSNSGEYWFKSNQVLIGKSDQANNQACIHNFDLIQVNLKTGELRTPGMQAFLNSKNLLRCTEYRHG
jgi:hypothetical protein